MGIPSYCQRRTGGRFMRNSKISIKSWKGIGQLNIEYIHLNYNPVTFLILGQGRGRLRIKVNQSPFGKVTKASHGLREIVNLPLADHAQASNQVAD